MRGQREGEAERRINEVVEPGEDPVVEEACRKRRPGRAERLRQQKKKRLARLASMWQQPQPGDLVREDVVGDIVVTTGIEPSSNIGNALVSAMYGRSSELGLYLWGNPPLPPVQGLPPPVGGG